MTEIRRASVTEVVAMLAGPGILFVPIWNVFYSCRKVRMNRRSFVSSLLGVATAGAAVQASVPVGDPAPSPLPSIAAPQEYRGYGLHWTGWKGRSSSANLVGQWMAWPLPWNHAEYSEERYLNGAPYLYVCVPGMIGGPYSPGSVFNTYPKGRFIDYHNADNEGQKYIDEGYRYIKQLADALHNVRVRELKYFSLREFPVTDLAFEKDV